MLNSVREEMTEQERDEMLKCYVSEEAFSLLTEVLDMERQAVVMQFDGNSVVALKMAVRIIAVRLVNLKGICKEGRWSEETSVDGRKSFWENLLWMEEKVEAVVATATGQTILA